MARFSDISQGSVHPRKLGPIVAVRSPAVAREVLRSHPGQRPKFVFDSGIMGLGDAKGPSTLGILALVGLGALFVSSIFSGSDKPLFSGLGRAPVRRRRSKTSPAARKYINKKIKILVHEEGYPQRQAVAVAYSMARKKGYKVPKRPRKRK